MRIIRGIIFRLFLSAIAMLLLFILLVRFAHGLEGSAGEKYQWLIILPMIISLFVGFILPELLFQLRWRRKWEPMSLGLLTIPDYAREDLFFRGLKFLHRPSASLAGHYDRLRTWCGNWAKLLLEQHLEEDWVWKVYELAANHLIDDEESRIQLKNLLFNREALNKQQFFLGLAILQHDAGDDDLRRLLGPYAMEFMRESERPVKLMQPYMKTLLGHVAENDQVSDDDLREIVIFLMDSRRFDSESFPVLVSAYDRGVRPRGISSAIAQSMQRLHHYDPEDPFIRKAGEILEAQGLEELIRRHDESVPDEQSITESGGDQVGMYAGAESQELQTESESEETGSASEGSTGTKVGSLDDIESPMIDENVLPIEEVEEAQVASRKSRKKRMSIFSRIRNSSLFGKLASAVQHLLSWGKRNIIFIMGVLALLLVLIIILRVLFAPGFLERGASRQLFTSDRPFTIQVAAHKTSEKAVQHLNMLKKNRIDGYMVTPQQTGGSWYKIRIGSFATTQDAIKTADSLKAAGRIKEYFVTRFEPGVIPKQLKKR